MAYGPKTGIPVKVPGTLPMTSEAQNFADLTCNLLAVGITGVKDYRGGTHFIVEVPSRTRLIYGIFDPVTGYLWVDNPNTYDCIFDSYTQTMKPINGSSNQVAQPVQASGSPGQVFNPNGGGWINPPINSIPCGTTFRVGSHNGVNPLIGQSIQQLQVDINNDLNKLAEINKQFAAFCVKPIKCDCGAVKCNTTHARWCSIKGVK
jgi:hypothetical protein